MTDRPPYKRHWDCELQRQLTRSRDLLDESRQLRERVRRIIEDGAMWRPLRAQDEGTDRR